MINRKIFTPENKLAWDNAKPFHHIVLDNFFTDEFAKEIAADFPDPNGDFWFEYQNKIEIKKALSDWNKFPSSIYRALSMLCSNSVNAEMEQLAGDTLTPDDGLHGGGMHCHKAGGKLNTHLDYTIHPKTGLMRRLNIIVYMTPDWLPEWNGTLGLWEHDSTTNGPGKLAKEVPCLFNRAVIFDTTQNSWHGLPDPVTCPPDKSRNSLALYYNCVPYGDTDNRKKALFAPHKEQANDPEILELIKRREDHTQASDVYRRT